MILYDRRRQVYQIQRGRRRRTREEYMRWLLSNLMQEQIEDKLSMMSTKEIIRMKKRRRR